MSLTGATANSNDTYTKEQMASDNKLLSAISFSDAATNPNHNVNFKSEEQHNAFMRRIKHEARRASPSPTSISNQEIYNKWMLVPTTQG